MKLLFGPPNLLYFQPVAKIQTSQFHVRIFRKLSNDDDSVSNIPFLSYLLVAFLTSNHADWLANDRENLSPCSHNPFDPRKGAVFGCFSSLVYIVFFFRDFEFARIVRN